MTDWAFELADNPNTYTPLSPHHERIVTDRYVLFMTSRGGGGAVAQRFRFDAGELEDVRAELHGQMRERGREKLAWEVGTGGTPTDLVDRLLALGLEDDGVQVGRVLDAPPAADSTDGIEVRRVSNDEEMFAAEHIAAVAFGEGEAKRVPYVPDPTNVVYLAYVDGEPAARGSASFGEHGVSLFGGSTLPEARGRGAYRALVAARWDDAVARGTPLLVTQASPMSHPILARLGFREVTRIRALNDRIGISP